MQKVVLARNAMATRFEITLYGPDALTLRAAGEEALAEIDRIEAQLSLFRPDSEVSRLNARAAKEWVRVTPELFQLLTRAQRLSQETAGAFDLTMAPLSRCWGFMGGGGGVPSPDDLAAARAVVGMNLLELKEAESSARFLREGVMLDFGALGKGYAVERAVDLLRESGMTSALINGGTSTVHALGRPPESASWKVALELPKEGDLDAPRQHLAAVELHDESISVSAVWGKSFFEGGTELGHVLDPRSGRPAGRAALAAVAGPSAADTDALSTALLVLGEGELARITGLRAGLRGWVVVRAEQGYALKSSPPLDPR